MERKVILKLTTGSHLFGTSTPESDRDYMGIYLPTHKDLFGIENMPDEITENVVSVGDDGRNTSEAVDCKYFSLVKWMINAGKGQPWALEFLFAPYFRILEETDEWKLIRKNKHLFLSRDGIGGFVGFAKAQVNRATLKGENLKEIRRVIEFLECITEPKKVRMQDICSIDAEGNKATLLTQPELMKYGALPKGVLRLRTILADDGTLCLRIGGGRKFNFGSTVKQVRTKLGELEKRYGHRVQQAAEEDYDWKCLYHAYRNLFEVKEFLETGNITLPRPQKEIDFLMRVRGQDREAVKDFETYFSNEMDNIQRVLKPKSPLPQKADWSKINKLCQKIISEHTQRGFYV